MRVSLYLEEVVNHHHPLNVERLPVLHEPGPGHSDDVVVEEAEDHRGPGGGHQEPVVHPADRNSKISGEEDLLRAERELSPLTLDL